MIRNIKRDPRDAIFQNSRLNVVFYRVVNTLVVLLFDIFARKYRE